MAVPMRLDRSYFLDSNALVKRYYREHGSNWVQALCNTRTRPLLYISALAEIEVVIAIRRKVRENNQHESYADALINQFKRDLAHSDPGSTDPEYLVITLEPAIIQIASNLGSHLAGSATPIRTLDALQLSSAFLAQTVSPHPLIVVTSDKRFGRVIQAEQFALFDPESV